MRMLQPEQKAETGRTITVPQKSIRMLRPAVGFDLASKGELDTSLEALLPQDTLDALHKNPNVYGAIGALYETGMSIGNFALDVIPGAKYLRPQDREEYLKLDLQHQVRAGLYEALGASLFTPGGAALFRLTGKGVVKGAQGIIKGARTLKQRVKPRLKVKPIEDLATWTTRDYQSSLNRYLKKRHFTDEEAGAIYNWFDGDVDAIRQGLIQNRLHGKTPSKAMEKILVQQQEGKGLKSLSERQGKDFWLDHDFIRKVDPSKLRLAELHKNFIKTTSQQELLGKKYGRSYAELAFKTEAEKYYGVKAAKKLSLKKASETELVNFAESMLKDKRAVLQAVGTPAGAGLSPVRVVFGRGTELGFNTYERIYERTVSIFGKTNEYTVARINTCRAIWEQRGLGKVTFKDGKHFFKRSPGITKTAGDEALKVLQAEDNLLGAARKINTKEAYAEAKNSIANLINSKTPEAPAIRAIVDATHDYFDLLYGEDALVAIMKEFGKTKMSPSGQIGFEKLLTNISPRIQQLFSTGASHNYVTKHNGIKSILKEVRGAIPPTLNGRNRWFKTTGKKLEGELTALQENLTLSSQKGGQFVEYLESYMPRIGTIQRGVESEIFNALKSKYTASYTKARELGVSVNPVTSLEQLIVARTRAQAKRMYLYDELGEVAKFASKLPENWRNYTEHFIARALNLPSRADENLAKIIGATVGKFQKDPWNAARVMNLAKNVNDFSYMGFLGLKPFSASRNLFQPFLLVPADLGGIKDYGHLVRGVQKALRKETRTYLDGIGIITEFAPELSRTAKIFGASGKNWAGIPIPDIEATRDITLWMFKNSDKFNRYVTGSAAMSKWDGALNFVGGKVTKANLNQFMSKAGINGRHSWIKDELKTLLSKGHMGDAKAGFIRDVVADTQFLYGKLDSPLITQTMGATGRTIAIFQSWWMNYGHLINKWVHTGQSPTHLLGAQGAKAERAITWMLSASAGFYVMQKAWGSSTAMRSVFFGPFPDLSKGISLPPAWQPVAESVGMVAAAAQTLQEGSWKPLNRQGLALLDSVTNFLPGALQAKMTAKATMQEGFPGFTKSVMRFRGKGSVWED